MTTADEIFEGIAHGDSDHRAWLREALNNVFSGFLVPAPRGKNTEGINEEAHRLAMARGPEYGETENCIATEYLFEAWDEAVALRANPLPPGMDFAIKMVLVKIGRLATGPGSRDTFVDMAGYSRLAHTCWEAGRGVPDRQPDPTKSRDDGRESNQHHGGPLRTGGHA